MAYFRFNRQQANRRQNQLTMLILWTTVIVTIVQMTDQTGDVQNRLELFLPALWSGNYWQLLSVTLVHGGAFHIFMNAYALWAMGSVLEPAIGKIRFGILYVASALGGSIAVSLLGLTLAHTVGASGAIFGLFGAVITFLYSRMGSMRAVWFSPIGRQLLVLLLINVAISFLPGISALGHFGGLIVGAFLGYLIERQMSKRLAPLEKLGAVLFALILAGATVYACMPVHRGAYWLIQSANAYDRGEITLARELFEKIGPDIDQSPEYAEIKNELREALFGSPSSGNLPSAPAPSTD